MKPLLPILTALCLLAVSSAPAAPAPIQIKKESFESGGRKIHVKTFLPAGNKRCPAVLVLHSSAGTLAGVAELESVARQLAEQGQVAFFVRYFDRTRTTFANEASIIQNALLWNDTVRQAVDFAAAHPRVDPRAIGLFGYSLGGYLAVSESSQDPRIRAIVEVAGGIFAGFTNKIHHLPPMLVIHGREDERVPLPRSLELQKKARAVGAKMEVRLYDHEGHRLTPPAIADATKHALAFFKKHLRVRSTAARLTILAAPRPKQITLLSYNNSIIL